MKVIRNLTIKSSFNGYGDVSDIVGSDYTVALWHDPSTKISTAEVNSANSKVSWKTDNTSRVTVVTMPVADAHTEHGVTIQLKHANSV